MVKTVIVNVGGDGGRLVDTRHELSPAGVRLAALALSSTHLWGLSRSVVSTKAGAVPVPTGHAQFLSRDTPTVLKSVHHQKMDGAKTGKSSPIDRL